MTTARDVTLFAAAALLPEGWRRDVRIQIRGDGRFGGIEAGVARRAGDVRLAGRAAIPALANLHSHAHQRAMAGRTERRGAVGEDDFWSWRRVMYALLADIGPDELMAIAAFAYKEMLEAGFAAVGEFHYLHHAPDGRAYAAPAEMCSRIAEAAALSGIGLTLLPVRYAQGGVDGRPVADTQRRFATEADGFDVLMADAARALGVLPADAVLGVAAHSLRAVDAGALDRLVVGYGAGPIHIHVAEQPAEVAEVQAALGARPVEWLLANADVDARWCLVHATHMTASETRALAASGAVAGLCPITEANLGDGIFPADRFRAAGGRFGIGSDSNVAISATAELRMLEYGQRLRDGARAVLTDPGGQTGLSLYLDAAAGGARALGRGEGRIETGAWADLASLDLDATSFVATNPAEWLDVWIFAAGNRGVVRDVWSAGRHVVRDGLHIAAREIDEDYRQAMRRLFT